MYVDVPLQPIFTNRLLALDLEEAYRVVLQRLFSDRGQCDIHFLRARDGTSITCAPWWSFKLWCQMPGSRPTHHNLIPVNIQRYGNTPAQLGQPQWFYPFAYILLGLERSLYFPIFQYLVS